MIFKLNKILVTAVLASSGMAMANEGTIGVAYQNGLTYFPILLMEANKTYEAHATKLGIKDPKANYSRMSGPGAINDALLTKSVHFASVGPPSLGLLYDKTNGGYKTVASLSYMPLFLNTNSPRIKSLDDIKEGDKIALPTVKTSIGAVMLQMAVAQKYGIENYAKLDKYTTSMSHPDGMTALMSGKTEINLHFTSPPFQYQELDDGKGSVRTIVNSYDVTGGKSTFVLQVGNVKFVEENPLTYKAFSGALEESINWINNNKIDAAKKYIELSKTKESLNDVLAQLTDKDIEFNPAPRGLMKIAQFQKDIGTIKTVPKSWKDYTFSNLHNKAGS